MTIFASRWLITGVLVGGLLTSSAPAQPAINPALDGVYNGSYIGAQGLTKFKLTITQQDAGVVGVFTLYLPEGSDTRAYTCDVSGDFIPANRKILVFSGKWKTPPPGGVNMRGMDGVFDPVGGNGLGQISGDMLLPRRGPKFEAIRDAAESAKTTSSTADTKEAGAPATQIAPPARRPTAANRAAPSLASSPTFERDINSPATINGVYTGTYGSNADDKVSAKLYVKFINDGSVNGALTGLFTLNVPPSPGAKPITYTYKLTGRYHGMFEFYSAQPLGKPAPDAYAMKSLDLSFAQDHWPKFNPDKITSVINRFNPARNTFEAARDEAESAKLDSSMAALTSAAGAVVSMTAPAPAAPIAQPRIEGVYNGTYTRANESPAKFKLTITQTRYDGGVPGVIGLVGLATIYLPTDSGPKAYTYSLKGTGLADGTFSLAVYDWETTPPKDFKDFRGMGFGGTFLSNANLHTARIINVHIDARDRDFLPKFEATWDATESADIKGTIAAQKAVRVADEAAAVTEHAQAVKNAPPKQLASKNLVRKSQAYWNSYQGDLIRQVFDGGFADDVNDDWSFQLMFTTYVELFSKNCSADLPANHHPITIITTTYSNGYVVKTESKTIDIDPRFIPKYCEFSGVKPDPGSPEASDLAAKNVQTFRRIMQAGTPAGRESNGDAFARFRLAFAHPGADERDLNKFFATEPGSSAATRQLGENLLRGATGEPSLQEAGAKIDGAEAETDKDLPPGRFTHLIDAANAFCRDPANASYRSQYETTFYMVLAEKYRGVMTPEEEYYYANDFAVRFRDQIMGTRANSTDPAWPRLHPAVEECMKELGR